MSFDHTVVVRGRKRKAASVRATAAKLAPLGEQEDEDDLFFDGVGSVQLRRLVRGYEISVDSNRDGNRERWEDLCELADRLAAALGEIVEDAELAAQMCSRAMKKKTLRRTREWRS